MPRGKGYKTGSKSKPKAPASNRRTGTRRGGRRS
jgi:hypothetical protein